MGEISGQNFERILPKRTFRIGSHTKIRELPECRGWGCKEERGWEEIAVVA